jgi:lipopolysaccharide transport system permease protein
MKAVMEAKPYIVIKPKKGWQIIDFKELMEYRDLLYLLVSRNVKVRYKQTVLGGLWAIIQPFFMMIVFSVFFGKLGQIPSDGVPYPIFNYSAMIAWTYFSGSLSISSNSLISEAGLISKVYFPRMIIPLAPIFAALLDFVISFIILILMMFYYHIYPTINVLFLPFLVIIMMLAVSGIGMFLSAMNAKYRDIGYTIPFLVLFWMFASPVVYPVSLLPAKYHLIYAVNPMVGIIEGFRSALLGTVAFPTWMVLMSAVTSIILFIVGAMYFKLTERFFADII